MPDAERPPAPLWDRAGLPSRVAITYAARVTGLALLVAALVSLAGGWAWALSVLLGGGVVLLVLWGSARVLTAGVRRSSPPVALLLALGLYLLAVVGLFVLVVQVRSGVGDDGTLRARGVAGGGLGVVVVWTAALVVVHVRHDRGPRRRDRGR